MRTATRELPPSLLLKNCRLVNVYSSEIYPADVAVQGERIAAVTPPDDREAAQVIDCDGLYAVPGLIDCHMHVDTTLVWPGELARVLVPRGITTVFVDTTNVITTGGVAAVRALIDAFRGLPLRAFFSAPSYCPLVPGQETVAEELTLDGLDTMLDWPAVVGIGEAVAAEIVVEDEDFLARAAVCLSKGKVISGHGGGLLPGADAEMDAYVSVGVRDDHVVMTPPDVLPRLRRGLRLFVVESAGRENLSNRLLEYFLARQVPTRYIALCIDNISVLSVVGEGFGYLERAVQVALRGGLPPVEVIRMVTLNAAEHYHQSHIIGSIAPGRLADVLLLRALDEFPPEVVIVGGRVVARRGELGVAIPSPSFPSSYRSTIRLHPSVDRNRLAVRVPQEAARVRVRVFRVTDRDAAFNTADEAMLSVVDGFVQPDLENDVLKFCVVERYGRNGNVAVGFAQGFGLRSGALASSTSVPSNNIVAVGTRDDEIWSAIQRVEQLQGGTVVLADGQVLAEVPLPLGGVMAEMPYEQVVEAFTRAQTLARTRLGCTLDRPFHALAATVLPTLPDFGMTDRGLVDVRTGQFVPVVISVEANAAQS